MSKHTPGPWHLFEKNRLCIESDTGNVALCNLARDNEHDAKLIAAAPDLLVALRDLLSWQDESKHAVPLTMLQNARMAIDKATT